MKIADKFTDPMDRKSRNGYEFLQDMGGGKLHLGHDFNKGWGDQDLGLQISAIASGRIIYSKDSQATLSYGNMIVIEHELPDGSKFYSRYAHLRKRWIAEGQDIECGAGIGECGKSGGWKSAHLHLEIFTKEYWEQFASKKVFYYPSGWARDKILRYFCSPLQFIDEHKDIKTDEEPEAELAELKKIDEKYNELLKKLSGLLDSKPNEGDIESKIEGLLTKEDKLPEVKKETETAVAKPQQLIDSLCSLVKCPEKEEKPLRTRLVALVNLEIMKKQWETDLKQKENDIKKKIDKLKKLSENGGEKEWVIKRIIQSIKKFCGDLLEFSWLRS